VRKDVYKDLPLDDHPMTIDVSTVAAAGRARTFLRDFNPEKLTERDEEITQFLVVYQLPPSSANRARFASYIIDREAHEKIYQTMKQCAGFNTNVGRLSDKIAEIRLACAINGNDLEEAYWNAGIPH